MILLSDEKTKNIQIDMINFRSEHFSKIHFKKFTILRITSNEHINKQLIT